MGLAGTRRHFNICLSVRKSVCVRVCVCACVALNKWPMTHNKNYYEWTRTRKTHWPPFALPTFTLLPSSVGIWHVRRQLVVSGYQIEGRRKSGVYGGGDVTNDCYWHPLGTGRPRLDSQELELGFVPQRARASRFNWDLQMKSKENEKYLHACEVLWTSLWGPNILIVLPSIVGE